jgi:hypothetical protein
MQPHYLGATMSLNVRTDQLSMAIIVKIEQLGFNFSSDLRQVRKWTEHNINSLSNDHMSRAWLPKSQGSLTSRPESQL